ncbi:probable xyloglucan endotransglucosylase/hydrolase protein 33 [Physcomitrium patens]|nr:hypothetical protein PHYPA_017252 [Physcomitrium patens]
MQQLMKIKWGMKSRVRSMGVAAGIPRISFLSVCRCCRMKWCVLFLQMAISAAAVGEWTYVPVVDVRIHSNVLDVNSSRQAQFVPMFGAPGDIDSSINDGHTIRLRLESHSGSGIKSQNSVFRGFFNAAIKLPCGFSGSSAGIVSAFYASNGGYYPYNHDEIDMEFLGVRPGQPYVIQTNIYADGNTETGREERFHLWFDPTVDFHNYSILWTYHHIVFFVDDIPIRRYVYQPELGIPYPAKPMSAFATIWDGSTWATEGGQFHVNYTEGPFDATFTDFQLEGCIWDPRLQFAKPECALPTYKAWFNDNDMQEMSDKQMIALEWARSNFMWYSYCDDLERWPEQPPRECPQRLGDLGSLVTSESLPSSKKGPCGETPELKPLTRPWPKNLPSVSEHKHKLNRNTGLSTKSQAFHYLPYSLWKTKLEVKLLEAEREH